MITSHLMGIAKLSFLVLLTIGLASSQAVGQEAKCGGYKAEHCSTATTLGMPFEFGKPIKLRADLHAGDCTMHAGANFTFYPNDPGDYDVIVTSKIPQDYWHFGFNWGGATIHCEPPLLVQYQDHVGKFHWDHLNAHVGNHETDPVAPVVVFDGCC